MTKDQIRMMIFFVAMAGLFVVKTLYFPCNCSVNPPGSPVATDADELQIPPHRGLVRMIDLGAGECVPCKMMAPIIEEVKNEYVGKAEIIFIDVWKHPAQSKKYGVRVIPTQIFFDATGKEAYRHTGFMDKKRIVNILVELGVS